MSINRVSGLASGMDIDSIVSDLMKVHRIPLDKMYQEKQRLEWKKEAYREINSKLSNLRELAFSLKLQRTFNAKRAESSNVNVVEASAGAGAADGVYSISVFQLAKGAYLASDEAISLGSDTRTLDSLGLAGTYTFTINGKEITVDAAVDTISSLVKKINSAGAGVTASYDSGFDRLFLSTPSTGADAVIDIDDAGDGRGAELFAKLKINLNTDGTAEAQGQDAVFTINGIEMTSSSNTFTLSRVTFTLKGISQAGSDTLVTVGTDVDAVYKSIVDFVNAYNEVISHINGKLTEEYYRDYPPLTDEMRKELDEDQIEEWTKRAKSGLLKNDSLLFSILSGMRRALSDYVEDASIKSLSQIGITTGSYSERGKLYVDEAKLKQTISESLEGIMELFTDSAQGIGVKVYDEIVRGITLITKKAGSPAGSVTMDTSELGRRIRQLDERMDEYEKRLEMIENRYWNQFTVMEKFISEMNYQSLWLTQQFGMWSSSGSR
ncbi:MAG TPA: flagellar cap protein [Peptococcaceae bacterium]|nr:MAG: Flagellar capping protein [Clostridia bacterium 41_269]HBT20181.1 flagellar cap protein [Peptococcaceae bacterium]